MDRTEEQAVVVLERRLGAVAVVDVEIDHGDTGEALGLGRSRGDGDVGEQAETHGTVRLCMMAGRADGGEGAGGRAPGHGAHGVDRRSGGQAGGADAARRQDGVGVQLVQAFARGGIEDAGDIVGRMQPFEIGDGGLGRSAAVARQARVVQRVEHGLQPLRPFRVSGSGPVPDHVGVGEEGCAHDVRLCAAGGLVAFRSTP